VYRPGRDTKGGREHGDTVVVVIVSNCVSIDIAPAGNAVDRCWE